MNDLSRLYTGYYSCAPDSCVPLTGSASNRKYYRLSGGGHSCIGVVGTDIRENEAFIAIAGHFRAKGINVPEVYAVSDDRMSYIQEDLGEAVLFDMLTGARKTGEGLDKVEELLCRTMSMLPKIQYEGAEGLDFSVCYPQPSFDRRMVMFDLNYFKYCFLKPSGLEFDEVALQDDFEKFADDLLEEDTDTFLYRDLNARNVMICDGEPYFVDFQGGRRGPVYYDVASFVWHARAGYQESVRQRMLDSYLDALAEYRPVVRDIFVERLNLFILFRLLQVLGAYGFRGLVEQKANFVTSIPAAISELKDMIEGFSARYPYMVSVLGRMCALPRFEQVRSDGVLEVKVYSFSFKKGVPYDPTGNGGGYVFDCRSIHNPGRYEPYKKLTGRDEPVIRFLEDDGEVFGFLEHAYGVVDPHVETYMKRGFTSLMVSFGCTGGQHRSVYCAEHMARHLAQKYPGIRVRLIHREQHLNRCVSVV
jgi:aminoglycoside/choline kinase family phosphotransferase